MVCPQHQRGPFAYPETDEWSEDGTCSYCGSMNPDKFMELLEANSVTLTPTDKPTKVYVNMGDGPGKVHKMYFVHMSEEQQRRFVYMYNARMLRLREPGYFYALPYFMGTVEI